MYYLNALFDHATTNWCMTIKTSLDTFFFPFSETIFNRLAKFIFWRTNLKNQLQQNFQMQNFSLSFWSCYSTSLDKENTVATSNEFFYLKKLYSSIKNNSFSLLSQRLQTQQSFPHKILLWFLWSIEKKVVDITLLIENYSCWEWT